MAGFARLKAGDKLLDLGCGCGILGVLLEQRTGALVTAVDIQPEACALCAASAGLNGQVIRVLQADLRQLHLEAGEPAYDAVVCNPPYFSGGTQSPDPARRLCTHQEAASMGDVAACARRMLKNGGRLFLCYPAQGLAACLASLVNEGLAPKRMRPVAAGEKPPYLILLEARKGGGEGLLWEETIRL
ncbi:tRNA1(Val) (adenine(37)-N6)-methyltransferase [bioreactor metagenome]|uniref:tRNA1(Val) (Adenine(37)-N6)-methyltransferase n=1 Tax=bioreactor metagenome TaxID=1076179 RepID=A0A645I5J1_9ZZZZ